MPAGAGGFAGLPPWLDNAGFGFWTVQIHGFLYDTPAEFEDGVTHVLLEGVPVEVTIHASRENDLADVVRAWRGLTFRAKASRPLSLQASIKSNKLESDYFYFRNHGEQWPVAPTPPVTLGAEWVTYEVRFSDMVPRPVAEAPPEGYPPNILIAFIVQAERGPIDLWLEAVRFF